MGTVPLEYADEDYFPEIQTAMLERLDQQIYRMINMQEMPLPEDLPEGVDEEAAAARAEAIELILSTEKKPGVDEEVAAARAKARAEANAGKLAELEDLKAEIEGAGSLDDLKAIAFSHAKDRMSNDIDREIEKFTKMQENLDSINLDISEELLASTIADLKDLQEQVNGVEDREDLREIGESVREIRDSFREEAGIERGEGLKGREERSISIRNHIRNGPAGSES
ncbi:hypothetical protein ACSAZK_01990 [Methanosarcina sp. Mfa9]|uniref:hypothetical protein n=1 Tax=Methanosarcina sp. Mfa9 TaxID=3439063 RepID=UPI003F857773